jgi:Alkylmercury lyase
MDLMDLDDLAALDRAVRVHIFRRTADSGLVPTPEEIASDLQLSLETAQASLRRLAEGRVVVLSPSSPAIWMANPFSAVATDFGVTALGRTYFGNCIWDALGIPALLGTDGVIDTSCGDCGSHMRVEVRAGTVQGEGIVHFAVPARQWWVNVGFT